MAVRTLTIEFPETAKLPEDLHVDQEFLRYAVAGALYTRGLVSGREARELTGDSRRTFEEKMSLYGYPLMPSRESDVQAELSA